MTFDRKLSQGLLVCLTLCLLVGCSHMRVRDRWFDSDTVTEVPSEILPIWTDTVLHQPGKPGVRGFGGRVYFYVDGKPEPVPVDGQLVVYAFDGNTADPNVVAPLRKYVITPEQLKRHHSDSTLGHSYSVWVPWDRVGGEGRTLSLVVRFDGRSGGTALSKPARMLLPGIDAEMPLENERKSGVQLASHTESDNLDVADSTRPTLETSSIDLPPSFRRRLWGQSSAPLMTEQVTSDARSDARSDAGPVAINAGPGSEESASYDASQYSTLDSNRQQASGWEPLSLAAQAVLQQGGGQNWYGPSNPNVESTAAGPVAAQDSGRQWAAVESPMSGPMIDSPMSADFEPQRFPARRTPRVQPGRAPLRRQPHPAGWPSVLPLTPRSGFLTKKNPDYSTPDSTDLPSQFRQAP